MKISASIVAAVGTGLICAVIADLALYAFGIGTMHVIGTYDGRKWMGYMTLPAWSFLAGGAGSVATSIWMIRNRQIRLPHLMVVLLIYLIGFLPLAKWWFMNPRFHDSQTQTPPDWILGEKR